ncbi:hypothetical protein [Shewanella baltica]|uniref:hypothetical protein n=1 Tax=Shewanella baltica TaxID=62322 RepID=UPI00217DFD5F|nr:hypothetical protein [Shewanella baltica]MCS6100758.1 hypothetical protein [Shewanella baltica]MCS6183558.1 hypothetical protein [Shewanella baltica]
MKKCLLLFPLISLLGCDKPGIEWQHWCFPAEYLSPASYIKSNGGDTAFDSPLSDAPILFFPADYVAKNIIGFHATISTPNAGPLLQNLPVNFQVGSINTELPSDSQMESLLSGTNLLVLKERDIYHWAVYNKKEEKMQLWGSCDLSSKDDYECLRMIQHNEVNLRYSVHKENIKIYDKIDEFIINNLGQWRCKS